MRMHFLTGLIVAAGFAVTAPAFAADTMQQGAMKTCAGSWKTMGDADKKKTTYKDYMSTCMKKPAAAPAMAMKPAPAPAMAMKPAAAPAMAMTAKAPGGGMKASTGGGSAKCKDGKTVTYKNRSGTCSGHGGVATWM